MLAVAEKVGDRLGDLLAKGDKLHWGDWCLTDRDPLALMSLGIEYNDEVTITAEGDDEKEALAKMIDLFSFDFDFKR